MVIFQSSTTWIHPQIRAAEDRLAADTTNRVACMCWLQNTGWISETVKLSQSAGDILHTPSTLLMNRSRTRSLAPCQQVIRFVLCFSHRFCGAESCMWIWSSAQKRLSPWLYKRGVRGTRVLNKVWAVRRFWARCACSCDQTGVNTSCSTAWPAFAVYQRFFSNTEEMLFAFPGLLEALTLSLNAGLSFTPWKLLRECIYIQRCSKRPCSDAVFR